MTDAQPHECHHRTMYVAMGAATAIGVSVLTRRITNALEEATEQIVDGRREVADRVCRHLSALSDRDASLLGAIKVGERLGSARGSVHAVPPRRD